MNRVLVKNIGMSWFSFFREKRLLFEVEPSLKPAFEKVTAESEKALIDKIYRNSLDNINLSDIEIDKVVGETRISIKKLIGKGIDGKAILDERITGRIKRVIEDKGLHFSEEDLDKRVNKITKKIKRPKKLKDYKKKISKLRNPDLNHSVIEWIVEEEIRRMLMLNVMNGGEQKNFLGRMKWGLNYKKVLAKYHGKLEKILRPVDLDVDNPYMRLLVYHLGIVGDINNPDKVSEMEEKLSKCEVQNFSNEDENRLSKINEALNLAHSIDFDDYNRRVIQLNSTINRLELEKAQFNPEWEQDRAIKRDKMTNFTAKTRELGETIRNRDNLVDPVFSFSAKLWGAWCWEINVNEVIGDRNYWTIDREVNSIMQELEENKSTLEKKKFHNKEMTAKNLLLFLKTDEFEKLVGTEDAVSAAEYSLNETRKNLQYPPKSNAKIADKLYHKKVKQSWWS